MTQTEDTATPEQTAHKARAAGYGGAVTTVLLWFLGPVLLGVERPPVAEFLGAFGMLVEAVVMAVIGYIGPAAAAYFRRNLPKNAAMTPPLAVFLAMLILVLAACSGDRGAPLGDRGERCAVYETAYLALAVGRDSHNADQAARLRVYEVFLTSFCGGVPAEGPVQPTGT